MRQLTPMLLCFALLFLGCKGSPEATGEDKAGAVESAAKSISSDLLQQAPGSAAYDKALQNKLQARVNSLYGPGKLEKPRTRHLYEGGKPKFANRLTFETSPYLQQHAHNPVNWRPWGEAAFEEAKALNRPVFLSVGYSTCHWCHVMEEESFEDIEIAEFLNANFVAIKVDREERPDIDALYMDAVHLLNGRGGWPMTVIMMPNKQPFFGGTYFPPRAGVRGSRQGLLEILTQLDQKFRNTPEILVSEAAELSKRMSKASRPSAPGDMPTADTLHRANLSFFKGFDTVNGGRKGRTKFPTPSNYRFLLRYHRRTQNADALTMVTGTLDKMLAGGIYDQVGGGFHRYTTEPQWMIPHFEKMLYDNGQLMELYSEAYQVTKSEEYKRIIEETLAYVDREMTSEEGLFYSATDADSEGEEGLFFLWTPGELQSLLGEDSALVESHYGVTQKGNFEAQNILHIQRPLSQVCTELKIEASGCRSALKASLQTLYQARSKRIPPGLDDKVITSWNAMMISGYLSASRALGRSDYAETATKSLDSLWKHMWVEGKLYRTRRSGESKQLGFLDDYALFETALLDAYETTHELRFLERAILLQESLDSIFADPAGGYFLRSTHHERLLTQQKPDYDGAVPTGNSVAADNLLRLSSLMSDDVYHHRAERLFASFAQTLRRPTSMPRLLMALDRYYDRNMQIVLVPGQRTGLEGFEIALGSRFIPNRVIAVPGKNAPSISSEKTAMAGKSTAYVCDSGACKLPTTEISEFIRQVEGVQALPSRE